MTDNHAAITTPEQLVAAAEWEAIPLYLDRERTREANKPAQTIVWTQDVVTRMPETTVLALLNSSNATDVMARDIRRSRADISADEAKLHLCRRIFGMRTGSRGPQAKVVNQEEFAAMLAQFVDAGVDAATAGTLIASTLAKTGVKLGFTL